MLIGAVLNMRPDLFRAAVAGVPFVDVLTTMLDPSIPLTTSEWEVSFHFQKLYLIYRLLHKNSVAKHSINWIFSFRCVFKFDLRQILLKNLYDIR